jgi:hypothetical protein
MRHITPVSRLRTAPRPAAERLERRIALAVYTVTHAGSSGGGIWRTSSSRSPLSLDNTVVSGNTASVDPDIRVDSLTVVNLRSSAVGSPDGFTASSSSTGNLPYGVDPKLGPLADNGGPTRTHMPLPDGPLVDAGSNGLIPSGSGDQRGPMFSRVTGRRVDIGSVEQPPPPQARSVYVRSETWTSRFLGHINNLGRGTAIHGYAIPSEPGTTVPVGIDRISIDFAQENMSVKREDLTVTGSDGTAYPVRSFFYDQSWRTATPAASPAPTGCSTATATASPAATSASSSTPCPAT